MNTTLIDQPAAQSGTFLIGGDIPVHRLGFGSMRLTGKGVWGEPDDRDECLAVLRRALELGITLIDTADSYGPFVSEELIADALHPYPENLLIATKAGLQRSGPDEWEPDGCPEYLRERCEGSLVRLKVDCIGLFQLHRIDPKVPLEDQIGVLLDLQREGKIRHIGLSEVNVGEIEAVRRMAPVATVQNLYNLADRHSEAVLDYCTKENIGFIPWFPLAAGSMANADSPLSRAAKRLGATPGQLALAWLLKKSPVMLPIPGTSKVEHLESNTKAALVELDDEFVKEVEQRAIDTKTPATSR
ncbi:MAG: pyridoxine 4-dehydrogenase [Chthoniobacter sp.]|jgi:aryl-alcohol dehydrogenase-like predicted oxidoreductase|nr:pyridoxine 4-dehydrogenase [Chthoniobacter sp.]